MRSKVQHEFTNTLTCNIIQVSVHMYVNYIYYFHEIDEVKSIMIFHKHVTRYCTVTWYLLVFSNWFSIVILLDRVASNICVYLEGFVTEVYIFFRLLLSCITPKPWRRNNWWAMALPKNNNLPLHTRKLLVLVAQIRGFLFDFKKG